MSVNDQKSEDLKVNNNLHNNNDIRDMSQGRLQTSITYLFLFIELVLYIGFIYLDFTRIDNFTTSNAMKFISILMCFLFVLFPLENNSFSCIGLSFKILKNNRPIYYSLDIILLRFALVFTLISDYFLLFTDKIIPGLFTFILVQMIYLYRICRWKMRTEPIRKTKGVFLLHLVRNFLSTIFIYILLMVFPLIVNIKVFNGGHFIVIIASFYFVSLFFNLIDSIILAGKTRSKHIKMFAIGLFLFLLCDINVGLFNLADFVKIQSHNYLKLYTIAANAMWFFYLPSQVLISLSRKDLWTK